ncbi:MAG: tellurite resistance TerB family protein [Desulfobacterales bacterium]|nr:tellurite resistance TerB family protein [Desulfobacterales bacterium]
MFNPEKLLGGLLKESLGLKRSGAKGALGMGVLGLAIAAAEHFINQNPGTAATGGSPDGRSAGSFPLPPPPPGMGSPAPPPPPPGPSAAPQAPSGEIRPPTPPPAQTPSIGLGSDEAVLLIRAMIASANADGTIDAQERRKILRRLESIDLTEEEQRFLQTEFAAPCGLETIAAQVKSDAMARQVYAVSLMAVTVDTDAEQTYLNALAGRLGLSAGDREQIHREFDLPS